VVALLSGLPSRAAALRGAGDVPGASVGAMARPADPALEDVIAYNRRRAADLAA
jgi:hypothetical protein